jgi:hypothetical protein
MRRPSVPSVLRYLVILLALGTAARASADDRAEARAHYQAGMKYFAGGDYHGAIREFSAAQQIAPADLNNYNLALCYDKLGDPEPAIQYYRAFLDKQPGTDKRTEIEASINRLEAASQSALRKRADDAKRPSPPVLGPDAALAPGPVAGPAPPSPDVDVDVPAARKPPASGPAIAGSIGTPSTGTPVPTGDPQLDRANSIDIDQIRDRRLGTSSGIPESRGGPSAAQPPEPMSANSANGPNGPNGPNGTSGARGLNEPAPVSGDQAPKEDPVYKKWWFWVVVGVSAYVLYDLSQADSKPAASARETSSQGLTLLRW